MTAVGACFICGGESVGCVYYCDLHEPTLEKFKADIKRGYIDQLGRLESKIAELEGELMKAREEAHYIPSREAEELIARVAALEAVLGKCRS
jgi:hypothetical protein